MKKCKICHVNEASRHRTICCSCRYLHEKQNDPIGVAYRRLKSHAKKRGKQFSLTKFQFAEFCIKSEYSVKKGLYKDSLHIDRIDENKGYHYDNIQVLTNTQNVKKYCKWVERNRDGVNIFTTQIRVELSQCNFSDVPF